MSASALTVNNHVPSDEIPLTLEVLRGAMPKRQKRNITKKLVDKINTLVSDPEARNVFREGILGYAGILADSTVKMTTFLDAVQYVSYKQMGCTNQEAWIRTFPDRYQRVLQNGKSDDFIRATVSCYHHNKIVGLLLEQSMIPTWIINADVYQKAINHQVILMTSAKSETVRSNAADSLLTHLKQPEAAKLSVDVRITQDDSLRELKEAALELVREQKRAIEAGANTAEDIARGRIITGEAKRIN